MACAVAHYYHRTEAETSSTLDHFRYAIDLDYSLF
jgi:hypothetical protein